MYVSDTNSTMALIKNVPESFVCINSKQSKSSIKTTVRFTCQMHSMHVDNVFLI